MGVKSETEKIQLPDSFGKRITFQQAPCRSDGVILSTEEESKEGICRCSLNVEGCYVDGFGIIIPHLLKE